MTQSVPHPPPPPSTHEGYLSKEDKRKFTLTAGILAGAFIFLQLLIPMIAMFSMMPKFFSSALNIAEYDLRKAVVHDGDLLFFAESVNQGRGTRTGRQSALSLGLMKLNLGAIPDTELASSENPFAEIFGSSAEDDILPEEIARVEDEYTWLLAGGENLLIISRNKIWKMEGANLVEVAKNSRLSNASRPFYYGKFPAVIEGDARGYFLTIFENGQWNEHKIFQKLVKSYKDVRRRVQVVTIDDTNHLFVRRGETLLHRVGIPIESSRDGDKGWKSIGPAEHHWLAFALGDKPAVLSASPTMLRISTFENGEWSAMSHIALSGSFSRDFVPIPTGESLRVAATGFPGTLLIYSVEDDRLTLNARFGGGFPFPKNFIRTMFIINIVSLLFPILLAVILSGLMLKHRVSIHWHGGKTAQYASLSRRAIAQIVDGLIASVGMLPFIVSSFTNFDSFLAGPNPMMFPAMMLLNMGFAFLWMLILLFAFSLGESKWGVTPGKWLAGIRVVGADLRPCGFGRALLRNFLKVVDGYFSFLVGILLVTFTKKWQRLGDMAARTIVIRKAET